MKIIVSLLSIIAFLLVALAGPLYKLGVVELGTAFSGFKYGVIVAALAIVLFIIQIIFKRKSLTIGSAVIAIVLSALAIMAPLSMMSKAKNVPPIHDISTDTLNPPEFVAIAPLRADAPNSVEYAGEQTAAQQRSAYPELKTLSYSQSKADLIVATEQTVNNLGWELVNTDNNRGIVEATDETMWFGFKDDVVIRVVDNGNERLLDVRSKSRVGTSDLGKNAARIHGFIEELDRVLGE